jgi:hypothetical protein
MKGRYLVLFIPLSLLGCVLLPLMLYPEQTLIVFMTSMITFEATSAIVWQSLVIEVAGR